jgi:hypothetical protein
MINSTYPTPDVVSKLALIRTEWRRNTLSLGLSLIVAVARSKIHPRLKPLVCEVLLWGMCRLGPLFTDQFLARCKATFGL